MALFFTGEPIVSSVTGFSSLTSLAACDCTFSFSFTSCITVSSSLTALMSFVSTFSSRLICTSSFSFFFIIERLARTFLTFTSLVLKSSIFFCLSSPARATSALSSAVSVFISSIIAVTASISLTCCVMIFSITLFSCTAFLLSIKADSLASTITRSISTFSCRVVKASDFLMSFSSTSSSAGILLFNSTFPSTTDTFILPLGFDSTTNFVPLTAAIAVGVLTWNCSPLSSFFGFITDLPT